MLSSKKNLSVFDILTVKGKKKKKKKTNKKKKKKKTLDPSDLPKITILFSRVF